MTVDMSQFYQTFFDESFEGLDNMEACLLNLNSGEVDVENVNTIFRAAHSIKGGSATFGFKPVAEFTHVMETLLDQMRGGERLVTQEAVNLLLSSVDCLRDMLNGTRDGTDYDVARVNEVHAQLQALLNNEEPDSATPSSSDASDEAVGEEEHSAGSSVSGTWIITFSPHEHMMRTGNDPVRMFSELALLGDLSVSAKIDNIPALDVMDPTASYITWMLELDGNVSQAQIQEVFEWVDGDCDLGLSFLESMDSPSIAEKAMPETNVAPTSAPVEEAVKPVPTAPASAQSKTPEITPASAQAVSSPTVKAKPVSADQGSIRVSIDKIDALINMVGELVITQSMLGQIGEDMDMSRVDKLQDGLAELERNTRELQETVMRIRMLPISFAFQRFPRMVRDVSQALGKKVEIVLLGEQTELDKTVMEKIGDPLVHLVRNSVDHGIEKPEIRIAAGKPETGTVKLNAYHQGGNIVIEITDDGAGINKEAVRAKAIERGIISADETLSDEKIYDLIFQPGFSTAAVVSDISGRGVGMDVVKRNIRELGGSIEISSELGKGSRIAIRLPLTLAILDGQLVQAGTDTYIVPLVSIIESIQVHEKRLSAIAGKAELYKLRDEYIPIVRLYDVFGLKPKSDKLTEGLLVVVEGDGQRAAIFVDDLLGQQQVVIKSLETNFKRVEGVSGATILGDGTVALILDIGGLIKLSRDPETGSRRIKQKVIDAECSDVNNNSTRNEAA